MGFFVAIVWIMAIADEIINVLQVSGIRMTGMTLTYVRRLLALFLGCRMQSLV
jgi:hypothetical protein